MPVDPQCAEPVAFGLERLGADRGRERRELLAVLAPRLPWPEGIPEEGKGDVLVLARRRVQRGQNNVLLARARLLYLPRVCLPATGGAAPGRQAVHVVLARDQPRGAQGQKQPAPRTADPQAHRPVAGRPSAMAEPHRRRVVGSTARRRVSLAAGGFLAAAPRTGLAHSYASGSPQDMRWSLSKLGQALVRTPA